MTSKPHSEHLFGVVRYGIRVHDPSDETRIAADEALNRIQEQVQSLELACDQHSSQFEAIREALVDLKPFVGDEFAVSRFESAWAALHGLEEQLETYARALSDIERGRPGGALAMQAHARNILGAAGWSSADLYPAREPKQ